MTMRYSINDADEDFILRQVRSGRYPNADEVVHDALRLLAERDHAEDWQALAFGDKIAVGVMSLRAGNGVDGEAFFESLDMKLENEPTPAA